MSERTFTIEESEVKVTGGRFKAATPAAAAKKAARKQFREAHHGCKRVVSFKLRETTRGSDGAIFAYKGKKVKLDKPVTIKHGDVEITYDYTYSVVAL